MPPHAAPGSPSTTTPRRWPWLRLLRLHHWSKNVLLGVPYLTAQAWQRPGAAAALGMGFLAFSLVASASYVFNDLADLAADRAHATKRHRPLAAGTVRPLAAVAVALVFAALGLAAAYGVGAAFLAALLVYALLTTLYTRGLKRVAIADLVALAGLWVLRIVAGAAAIRVELSAWLLSFGAFLFMSLSIVKRCAELKASPRAPGERVPGRGYRGEDLPVLAALGVATGVVAVLVLALFVDSTAAEMRYPHHTRLWLLCPPIWFWLARLWLVTGRGEMHEDPVVYSLRDPQSWLALGAVAAVWVAASGLAG